LIAQGFKDRLDKARKSGLRPPDPPLLPFELIEEVSDRYVQVYENLSGRKL